MRLENERCNLNLPPPPREKPDCHYWAGRVFLKLEIDSLLTLKFLCKRSLGVAVGWKGRLSCIQDAQESVP